MHYKYKGLVLYKSHYTSLSEIFTQVYIVSMLGFPPLSRSALNQKTGSRGSKSSACISILYDNDLYDIMIKTLHCPPENNLSIANQVI